MNGPGAPSLQQPPSTSDADPPPPGAWCNCCYGTRWWTKRGTPYGWCCGWCHPPDHLQPEQVRWEPAPEPTGPLQVKLIDTALTPEADPTFLLRCGEAGTPRAPA